MEILAPKIDWITLTGLYPSKGSVIEDFGLRDAISLTHSTLNGIGLQTGKLTAIRPDRFYAWAFEVGQTNVKVNIAREPWQQGYKIVLSGKAIAALDQSAETLLATALDWPLKVKRLDIAVDVFGGGYDTTSLYNSYRTAQSEKSRRSHSFHTSNTGSTMYVGSRESERMLRVYDKGGEQNLDVDWTRLEMEFKGNSAMQAALIAKDNPLPLMLEIVDAMSLPVHPLMTALSNACYGMVQLELPIRNPVGDALTWWVKQVIPAYEKLLKTNPDIFDAVTRMIDEVQGKR